MAGRASALLFGEVAIELGFITVRQLKEALDRQAAAPAGERKLLGVILVEAGHLTPEQVGEVLARSQRARGEGPLDDDADTVGCEVA
jgi:hypothetical protein